MSDHVNVPVHLLIEPTHYKSDGTVMHAKVSRATQRPPSVRGEGVVVRLVLCLPTSAFEPLQPEYAVEIPDTMTRVQVVVSDPEVDS